MNANPYQYIFFCASFRLRQLRFFCIMSWSRPVMTMVMKMPLRNCFQKNVFSVGLSKNHMRAYSELRISLTTPPKLSPSEFFMAIMVITKAVIINNVCSVSVKTMVRMPPLKVYRRMSIIITTTVSSNGTPQASKTAS